jgi:predicted transcriptional regulator
MPRKNGDTEVMEASAAERFVIDLLKSKGPLTTMEIEVSARQKHKRCPDQTVLFLTKMKKKGLIKGEASLERRGWVWWLPQVPPG